MLYGAFHDDFTYEFFLQLTIVLVLHPEVVGDDEAHAGVDPLELVLWLPEPKSPVKSLKCPKAESSRNISYFIETFLNLSSSGMTSSSSPFREGMSSATTKLPSISLREHFGRIVITALSISIGEVDFL